MTTSVWCHLPNAKHIDRILTRARSNPDKWAIADVRVWDVADDADWDIDAARHAARDTDCDLSRHAAWNAARDAVRAECEGASSAGAARDACGYAILALIVWDESADYLKLSVDQVTMFAALGDHKAILMLPAVMVFKKSKELV
jgi:hypothetical protein